MDFKFLNEDGAVAATAKGACAAEATLQQRTGMPENWILLDDTGIEVSAADLKVLCAAERRGATSDT